MMRPGLLRRVVAVWLLCGSMGAFNGMVRYKLLGWRQYAALRLVECVPMAAKPVALVGGVLVDAAIGVADVVLLPIAAVPVTWSSGGPDASGIKGDPRLGGLVILWYPLTLVALPLWPNGMYRDVFGESAGGFRCP